MFLRVPHKPIEKENRNTEYFTLKVSTLVPTLVSP